MCKGTIIYVGHFELPDKNAAAHRVMSVGKIFRDIGYRVAYLGTTRDEYFDGVKSVDYSEDIYEEAYPNSTKKWVKSLVDTKNIQTVVSKYDDVKLIILYNVPYATFCSVKKAFKKTDIKVSYDCTEWNNYAEGSVFKRWYKKFDEFQIRNLLGKKADSLIVISSLMEQKYNKSNDNILILPPLVDLNDKIWHQDRIKNTDKFEFCFAGSMGNKESLNKIIDAFALLDSDNAILRIIGLQKDEFVNVFPDYKATIESNSEKIQFMGFVSHEEAVKYVLSCDCYVFVRESTRRNEAGFPTKFVEAHTCAVPIITTDVSDIKRYMTDGSILLENTSVESIFSSMKKIISDCSKNKEKKLKDTFDYSNYINESKNWFHIDEKE